MVEFWVCKLAEEYYVEAEITFSLFLFKPGQFQNSAAVAHASFALL
jgi:hypothetical protein